MLAMNQPMLSIGRFSQLTGLTMRALRLYDELGLLRPDVVDADSRYRYYTTEQIKSATLIGRLRRLDMPLEEVGLFLSGETQVREQTLAAHRSRLLERVQSATWAMRALDEMADELAIPRTAGRRRVTSMVLQTLRDQPVMRIRIALREEDLRPNGMGLPEYELPGRDQPRDWRTFMVWKYAQFSEIDSVIERQDLILAGPPYLSCSEPGDDGTLHAEIGLQLDRLGIAKGRVEPAVLPGGDVATLSYTGHGATVGIGYRQLWAEMEKARLTPAGEPRELLMTNPAWDPNPDHAWVQLIWPVNA